MAKQKKVRIQIMMQPKMLHVLDQVCDHSNMSRSSIIEIAVFEMFKRIATEPVKKGEKA